MPSTYTRNLGIEKPATGEQAGTWGLTANNDFDIIDRATDGNIHIPITNSGYSLDTGQGGDYNGRYKCIIWTGTLTAPATVNITPSNAQKLYFMTNATSPGQPITFQQA